MLHIYNNILLIILSVPFLIGFIYILIKLRDKRLLEKVTSSHRGTKSERELVLKLLKYGLLSEHLCHDLYVKKENGKYCQIDLVAITSVGIIVFEVKDYSGWIFGNGNHTHWTKVLAYGANKYRFYNLIMQNNRHIDILKRQFPSLPFYSIIVFYGDCVLKDVNYIPKGTFLIKPNRLSDVLNTIIKENRPLNYNNINSIINVFRQAVINGENIDIQQEHAEQINDMLGKDRIFE